MTESSFNHGLIDFINASPTAFHAVFNASTLLKQLGFIELRETDAWQLHTNGRYFVKRNDAALIAFGVGTENSTPDGIRMAGAHTDSPGLKLKPNAQMIRETYLQLEVEVYGSPLLNPWFDRDLSLAGRVSYRDANGTLCGLLIDFKRPLAMIPSLAIHLNREANKGQAINTQKNLSPIMMQFNPLKQHSFDDMLLAQLQKEHPDCRARRILACDLFLYDTQPACLIGAQNEFISGGRLDNLLSCYIGLKAIATAKKGPSTLLVLNDHEEVGSGSTGGAQGPFLESVLHRILKNHESRARTLAASLMISMDNAHGLHPNFTERYDPQHAPLLNQGPVIKSNAGQRYASTSQTVAAFKAICDDIDIPVQHFVMRNDLACGSTIGPLTAARIGVPTVDVGVATLGMHSIRELAGARDEMALFRVLKTFFERTGSLLQPKKAKAVLDE